MVKVAVMRPPVLRGLIRLSGRQPQGAGLGDFRKLDVWRRSQALAVSVYRATGEFPVEERYGITAQMRRAALSVSSNLAEGCGRRGDPELRRFVRISQGSLAELECQLLLAQELGFIQPVASETLVRELYAIRGMLHALHQSLVKAPLDHRP
jgi:four helix bundle protein